MHWSIYTICGASFIGLTCGFFLAKAFARRSLGNITEIPVKENMEAILKSAEVQRKMILEEALIATKEQYQADAEQLENEREILLAHQEIYEQELNEKQSELDRLANELDKKEETIAKKKSEVEHSLENIKLLEKNNIEISHNYQSLLENKVGKNKKDLFHDLSEELVAAEKLGISKWLMDNSEFLKNESQRLARETLNSVYLRYQPNFIWPKSSFIVPVNSKDILTKYFHEESPIVRSLIGGTESSISVLNFNEDMPSVLKIAGGSGVDKEVIRLTLEEILNKDIFSEDKIQNIFDRNRKNIDRYILRIGEDAIKSLGLANDMHPEILKLIGSLNYRTSHRQNQYFHSIEVARLAGMIADEIGVSNLHAKRAGILHDIGKALDYKIEGSHAVISGDYAIRYGEKEDVVDTVLAHHDDKIVETPFAYILKAADALSGARPGARVDMEEGYHRRIDGISGVVNSFQEQGVTGSAIMHAGREVHVFVDNNKVKQTEINGLAEGIAKKLEEEVEFPGQIRVTVIRRTEITEVA
ncbi:HD domain-containing protein [Pigmentibacter ruber]|uniref:HD domain-containing protein n=1 Tax=Pigmentibacter ruber TaxID=2683196 RepID=UPI00131BE732|nr:HD domain-containing protein [Pigmentibacter ruber]